MSVDARHPEAIVRLATARPNAFEILGATIDALSEAGVPDTEIGEFKRQATAGDYDNLLRVTRSRVTVKRSRKRFG